MSLNVDIHNQDCIAGIGERLADGLVHLTVTSILFEELFTYPASSKTSATTAARSTSAPAASR
jgi:hypothetical protein